MRKNEKGFALILALVLLLVMSLMGGALIVISSGDHENNNANDEYQQTFYVAETALREGEQWLLDQYLGAWDSRTNKRSTTRGLPDNSATNWDGKMGTTLKRNNYNTNSSFFYNTNDVCYNSFTDLLKPIKIAHAESNNYGELLMKSFGSTSNDEKKEATYLQRYFYEFFVVRIGSAPFRGFGTSIKKGATNNASDGMAYRIFACGIFNADKSTNSNNSKKRVIVPLESIVVLPK
jgi:Tfp pilus assembly protein PilX